MDDRWRPVLSIGTAWIVGLVPLVVIPIAIFLGQWIDRLLGTKPVMLVVSILISILLSLILMVQAALSITQAVKRTRSAATHQPEQYEEQ